MKQKNIKKQEKFIHNAGLPYYGKLMGSQYQIAYPKDSNQIHKGIALMTKEEL